MADVVTEGASHGAGVGDAGAEATPTTDESGSPATAPTAAHASTLDSAPAPTSPAAPPANPASTASGSQRFPRRMVNAIVAAVLGLILLTAVINRVASSDSTPSTTTLTQHHVGGTAPRSDASQLHAPLRHLLDLTTLHGQQAASFSLTDAATGKTVTLASLTGRVVVLTFADADCKDICPVLAAELHAAAADLGTTEVPVMFVTVNSDPLATARSKAAILRQSLLSSMPGWMFLTGSVHQLNPVWKDYGISITVDPSTGVASHNDLLYFIKPNGTLAWSALPFADQSTKGPFSLPQPVISRYAEGIARYAKELAK